MGKKSSGKLHKIAFERIIIGKVLLKSGIHGIKIGIFCFCPFDFSKCFLSVCKYTGHVVPDCFHCTQDTRFMLLGFTGLMPQLKMKGFQPCPFRLVCKQNSPDLQWKEGVDQCPPADHPGVLFRK